MQVFFLGAHQPNWLSKLRLPLFVSSRRLRPYRNLPKAVFPWALDSGAFTEISNYGKWLTSASSYTREVRRYYKEMGNLCFAVIQDWMCEPFALRKTRLTIKEHIRRTVNSYITLCEEGPEIPWLPVIQGYSIADYNLCVSAYKSAGIDLARLPLVGVGSVCRRQDSSEVAGVIRHLSDKGLSLHGFGVKTLGLLNVQDYLTNADSMAWSFEARRMARRANFCNNTAHKNCANCIIYAAWWYEKVARMVDV